MKVVAVVGMCGAGKSVISDQLVENGYQYIRFGQITLDEVKRRGLPPTEENERPIREEFRRVHGMGAFAILNLPKIKELLMKGDVVADGLYSWTEYLILKKEFGEKLIVVAMHVSPETRYARLAQRGLHAHDTAMRNRPMTREQAQSRDYADIEKAEKGGPIAMADYHIVNEGTTHELKEKIKAFINWLEK